MKAFFPQTGSEAEWNAAYYRLEDYFRALHVVNKVHQSQIILELLEKAAIKHARNSDQNPTALAMEEAYAAMDRWLGIVVSGAKCQVSGESSSPNLTPDSPHVALVSLFITDAVEKWPTAFMADDVPPDLQRAMQESDVRAGPDLRVSSMVPRPIDPSPLLEAMLPDRWEKPSRGALVTISLAAGVVLALVLFFMMENL